MPQERCGVRYVFVLIALEATPAPLSSALITGTQDCRDVDGLVQKTFVPNDGPSALIVYVGQRSVYVAPFHFLRTLTQRFHIKLEGSDESFQRRTMERARRPYDNQSARRECRSCLEEY